MHVAILKILLILNAVPRHLCTEMEISVDTSFGTLTGLSDDSVEFGGEVKHGLKFLGIPFAKPPTGNSRFSRPEPEVPIDTPRDATFFRPHCPQSSVTNPHIKYFNTSEDCLYLNIFIPGDSIQSENRYPVMVWIYGGGFASGGADIYSGDILSAFNDVIVVTINYRVNVFGFLDDGSGLFANNGLYDQKLAIEWVHKHIQSLGGNPDQITLFGESAGGVSVVYQTLHKDNKGKIKRVISQSGSPLAKFAFQSSPKTLFKSFCARVSCKQETLSDNLDCLRNKSTEEIVSKLKMLDPFLPTVDGEFLTGDPKLMLLEGDTMDAINSFSGVDFMSGVNDKDGGSLVLNYWSKYGRLAPLSTGIPRFLFESMGTPLILRQALGASNNALERAAIHQYTDWSDPSDTKKNRDNIVDLTTDLYFLVPAIRLANEHADIVETRNTYLYQFSHRPWVKKKPEWIDGALHAWEIPYVFGLADSFKRAAGLDPNLEIVKPVEEIRLSRAMMKYWTNFARTGDPNSPELEQLEIPVWPKYTSEAQAYIDFTVNMTSSAVKHHLEGSRVNFWTDVAPVLQNECPKDGAISRVCAATSANSNNNAPSGSTKNYLSFDRWLLLSVLIHCLLSHFSF